MLLQSGSLCYWPPQVGQYSYPRIRWDRIVVACYVTRHLDYLPVWCVRRSAAGNAAGPGSVGRGPGCGCSRRSSVRGDLVRLERTRRIYDIDQPSQKPSPSQHRRLVHTSKPTHLQTRQRAHIRMSIPPNPQSGCKLKPPLSTRCTPNHRSLGANLLRPGNRTKVGPDDFRPGIPIRHIDSPDARARADIQYPPRLGKRSHMQPPNQQEREGRMVHVQAVFLELHI